MISTEKQLLLRIQNNEHNKICQQTNLKLTNCLCFIFDLEKILQSNSILSTSEIKKKRIRKINHVHWDKYNCGAKNRVLTSDTKIVTCQHCKKSNNFLALEKLSS